MDDYRLELRVKNNKLYSVIMDKYDSISAFCEEGMVNKSSVYALISMRALPVLKNGEIRSVVRKIMDFFYVEFEDLFNVQQVQAKLEKNVFIKTVSQEELIPLQNEHIVGLVEDEQQESGLQSEANKKVLGVALSELSPREERVLRMRFGMNDGAEEHTLDQIGSSFNISGEAVRYIEKRALRKLQHPKNLRKLRGEIE